MQALADILRASNGSRLFWKTDSNIYHVTVFQLSTDLCTFFSSYKRKSAKQPKQDNVIPHEQKPWLSLSLFIPHKHTHTASEHTLVSLVAVINHWNVQIAVKLSVVQSKPWGRNRERNDSGFKLRALYLLGNECVCVCVCVCVCKCFIISETRTQQSSD